MKFFNFLPFIGKPCDNGIAVKRSKFMRYLDIIRDRKSCLLLFH